MPKFLIKASYTGDGLKGLMKEGGTSRRAAVQKAVESIGGKLESFYYAYGDADAYIVCEFPAAQGGLALSMAANASGLVHVSTVPLITPEEMDAACKSTVTYRAPGT